MIRSWQPQSTGSGRSWTLCWFRTSITSSRTPRLPRKAPRRAVRARLPPPPSKILFENKPEFSPLLTPSNTSRCCKSLHFSLNGKLRPVPQASAPSLKRQLGREPAPITAGLLLLAIGLRQDWSDWVQPKGSQCSCRELTGMPGSRCHVRTLSSIPCSQENYDVLWTKDHFFFFLTRDTYS